MPYELLQDGDLQRAETLALGGEPSIEPRAAVDVKAAEKLAAEQAQTSASASVFI